MNGDIIMTEALTNVVPNFETFLVIGKSQVSKWIFRFISR